MQECATIYVEQTVHYLSLVGVAFSVLIGFLAGVVTTAYIWYHLR